MTAISFVLGVLPLVPAAIAAVQTFREWLKSLGKGPATVAAGKE